MTVAIAIASVPRPLPEIGLAPLLSSGFSVVVVSGWHLQFSSLQLSPEQMQVWILGYSLLLDSFVTVQPDVSSVSLAQLNTEWPVMTSSTIKNTDHTVLICLLGLLGKKMRWKTSNDKCTMHRVIL